MLIGRPESQLDAAHKGQDPIQGLFDQLRQRRLANEQVETYARQQEAAIKQRELNEARATADKQTELTQTHVDIAIAGNRGEAQLAEARRLAERDVTRADGEAPRARAARPRRGVAHRADGPRRGGRVPQEDPRLRRPAALRAEPVSPSRWRAASSRSCRSACCMMGGDGERRRRWRA